MSEDREKIPPEIKRAVRKKCGFGCIICGMPMFDYHHIEEHSVVQKHEEHNIVLLCPNHHAGPSRGDRTSKEVIMRYAASPHNAGRPRTGNYAHLMVGDRGRFAAGGCIYEYDFSQLNNRFDAIVVGGKTVLGLTAEDGHLLLDISLTDRAGSEILRVDRGEISISTGVWDYRFEGTNIVINSASYKISLDMTLNHDGVTVSKGTFISSPWTLVLDPDQHTIWQGQVRMLTMSGSRMTNCRFGLVCG